MNKALVLALFLGLAVTKQNQGWFYPNENGSMESVISEEHFAFSYKAQADLGYGTHYGVAQTNPDKVETYGLHLYSFAAVHTEVLATRFYKYNARFTFEPVYCELYNQHIKWQRPEADNGKVHFYVKGDRSGRALAFTTMVKENAQVFETSLVDWIDDMENNDPFPSSQHVGFDSDFEQKYMDNYWQKSFESKVKDLTKLLNANYYDWKKLF
ncbi:UNKNOWN [Stylonychia lemnae]|uniref:Uncharacterized protein n=1 Tax=Stylonychia lemnae TaxID=5949 RepID=A0A077ZQZ0_STYLE|nr:UNKNOWN [Stylonychia lemnae]|eukprot:CDW71859.1 UNKNOWN [Stylonychia lemnae]